MKRNFSFIFIIVLALLVVGQTGLARTHRFRDLQVEARLGADGVVRITERHTVQFDGKFTGMFQWIDVSRGVGVRDITISEDSVRYTRLERESPGPAGTYYVRTSADEVYVDWSFEAQDETRVFELSYVLDNVVLKHNDVAEFYYQFLGDKWEDPRDNVRVTLLLPHGAKPDEILAWGHGPQQGEVTIVSPQEIVWQASPVPARTFVEGRVVFPTRLVPLAKRTTNKAALGTIVAEEEGKVLRKERLERLKKVDPYTALFVLALFYLINVYIWYNYAKPYPGYKEKYYKELPADYAPAELGVLYSRPVDGKTFIATVLDLARRGYLTIEEAVSLQGKRGKEKAGYEFIRTEDIGGDTTGLQLHEQRLLAFLFDQSGVGRITLAEIEELARQEKKEFRAFWKEWSEEIKEAGKKRQFFERNKRVYWFFVPTILIFVLSIPAFAATMLFTGAASIAAGLVTLVLIAVASERRSPEGNMEYTKWRAFRRYLKDFSRLDISRIGSLGIWEEYVPYAFILGLAERVIKQLEVTFPNLEDGGYRFGGNWFIYHHTFRTSNFSHLTKTMDSSLTQTITSTGTGGSFSGGGGGGFGGGGGGVR